MSDNKFDQQNIRALWFNRSLTGLSTHVMPDNLEEIVKGNGVPFSPAMPAHFELLDQAGYKFYGELDLKAETPKDGRIHPKVAKWSWTNGDKHRVDFATLAEACAAAYWDHVGLSGDIAKLKQVGLQTVPFGDPDMTFYWRHMRGNRVSALFPTEEAAWRDAIRVYAEAEEKVAENPGVHRLQQNPQSQELSILKGQLKKAGYSFEGDTWKKGGVASEIYNSHAEAIRAAIRHWAKDDPDALCKAMNMAGKLAGPLTTEELKEIERLPGFAGLPANQQKMIIESQVIMKRMAERGIKFAPGLGKSNSRAKDACASYIKAYKAQGKPFEEVEEDQRRAKRAIGLVEGSEEEKQLRHLESIGYEFYFTSSWGWKCKPDVKASGALETVVKAAWIEAITTLKDGPEWDGTGQPPTGTKLCVTPRDTNWGFSELDPQLCQVLAYHNEYVWLQILNDLGEPIHFFVTTCIDKVDVKVWKGNNHA